MLPRKLVDLKSLLLTVLIVIYSTNLARGKLDRQAYQLETDDNVRSTSLKEQIRYLLYDRISQKWNELPRQGSVPNETWIANGTIKMIVHGCSFLTWEVPIDLLQRQGMFEIGEAYANANNGNSTFNIIVIDWSSLAVVPSNEYPLAAKSTKHAGLDIAEFLIRLKSSNLFQSWDDVHLIGYSAGAHVVGVAGFQIQQLAGGEKIGRITGIDPAGPEFDARGGKMPKDTSGFLEKSDAEFVDIIHCNMGAPPTWKVAPNYGRIGSIVQAGHADFYPDGGETQSQCTPQKDKTSSCSHALCPKYYSQSVTKELLACPCRDWGEFMSGKCSCDKTNGGQLMGSQCERSASGRYYVDM